MSGTARSHTRLRASGSGDLLAARGRGQLSDAEAARVLRKLGRAVPGDVSVPEAVAAHLRMDPGLSDDEIVARIRGLDDSALVARVRANLAAGHPPGHGLSTEAEQAQQPAKPRAWVKPAQPPPVPSTPPPRPRTQPATVDWATMMPRFEVVAPNGTRHEAATFEQARYLRARVGGQLRAVKR